jgi:RimJ/RimL family protein N-acetyltransferase
MENLILLREGFGTALTRYMLRKAKGKRLRKVSPEVVIENKRAIHAHKKCRFKIETKI